MGLVGSGTRLPVRSLLGRRACSRLPGDRPRAGEGQFRVCADPENLPFSNQKLEGFENKIAALHREGLGRVAELHLVGTAAGVHPKHDERDAEEGRCDVVIGVPEGYDLVRTTTPYYRSTYVFVYPKGKGIADHVARRSGAQEAEDRRAPARRRLHEPPPVHELSKRGIVDNVVGFSTFYSAENPPSAIIDAVAAGKIDVAIVWGPLAGYFVARQTRAAGDGARSVRKGRSAVRLRHLDGRQEGRRGAARASGARCAENGAPKSRRS